MFELDLTRVDYTWQPAGESQPNTFTAQNIFVSPTTTSAGAVFQANGTISAIPASEANVTAMFQGTEAVQSYTIFSSSAQQMNVLFRRRQGTYASPTAVQSGNVLGAVQWQGYGASTFGTVPAAQIRGVAREAFTESARGTALEFYTTATGTATQTLSFSIVSPTFASFGGDCAAANFQVNNTAGNSRSIFFRTSSSTRFTIDANTVAESGSNAGSNFEIRRYSDAGADLGLVMAVTRSSGNITFNGGGGITSFAANKIQITTAQTPANSAAAGNAGDIAWDDTYLYVRMSTGWRRIALGAAF
jgi:hypothetical protein